MIKFFQLLLEKHRKWVLGILLFVIIIPFVFTIGNMPGIGYAKRKRMQNSFLWYDLSDPKVVENVLRDSSLSLSFLNSTQDAANIQNYALVRLLLLNYAQHLRMPSPDEEQFQKFIRTKPVFWNSKKEFDPEIYNDYVGKWKTQLGSTQPLRKVLEEDFKCEAVRDFLSAPGFTLPQEIEWMFKRWKTTYHVQWVEFLLKDFKPKIEIKAADLFAYYEKNKKDYRVSKRAEVVFLQFDNQNYASKLSVPNEEDLKAYFESNKDSFKKSKEDVPSFENAKEDVKKHWAEERLFQLAEKAASDFSFEIYEKNIRPDSPEWNEILKRYGAKTIVVKPYSHSEVHTMGDTPVDLLEQAFNLDQERFLTEPSKSKNGWQLLCLKRFHEAYLPGFKEVKAKVEEDYLKQKRNEALLAYVSELQQKLKKSGQNFEDFATQEKVELHSLQPLTFEGLFLQLGEKIGITPTFDIIKKIEFLDDKDFLTPAHSDKGVVLLQLLEKKVPIVDQKSDEFTKFSEEYLQRTQAMQTETMITEAIEKSLPQTTRK